MDPDRIADHLLALRPGTADTPFLLARPLTDQLAEHPVDTRGTGWDSRIARTVGEAVEADLARLFAVGLPSAGLPVGGPAAGDPPGPPTGAAAHGRVLLTALGTALGNGYSREEWLAVASYDARQHGLLPSDGDYAGADLEGLMDTLGRTVIQDVFRGPDEGPAPPCTASPTRAPRDTVRPGGCGCRQCAPGRFPGDPRHRRFAGRGSVPVEVPGRDRDARR
ncbi:hypothetical protein [Streptomyces goshikiensis]|uniref:hypothetical protein n=1 Tax=Streptomyces goshikiensis TaxID=1942 RepID=UPI0036B66ABF